jgi:copper(I)-binding protein
MSSDSTSRQRTALIVVAAMTALSAACGSGGAGDPAGEGPLAVGDGWTAENAEVAAVYLTIDNQGGEDRLVGMASGAAGAIGVMGDAGVGGHTAEIAEVDMAVPAGETTFAPGERHIMLEELAAPLEPGDSFELTLEFEDHGEETVAVEVLSWDDAVERYEAG